MIGFIILTAVLSLLLIGLVHTMFNYFVNKTIDLGEFEINSIHSLKE